MANYIDIKTNSQINNLTVDSTTLHVDSANNRVGVGTITPSVAFEVVGAILADSISLDASYTPSNAVDVTTKGYVDSEIASAVASGTSGAEQTSNKGQANGYASLDSNAKVPANQLPSYVDDVEEYTNQSSFPGTGETGKLYVDQSNGDIYRWSGSQYIQINDAVTSSDQATSLANARDFSISGDVTASAVSFDGTGNVTLSSSISEAGVTQHEAALTIAQSQVTNLATALAAKADTSSLATVATSGAYGDLSGTPSLAAVATSGAYSDLSGTPTISSFGETLIDDADAAAARTTLGVDASGTDNSTDVTLASGSKTYISLSGQELSIGAVPVADITGLGSAATTASSDYATAAQGTKADSALQDITSESINDLSDVAITSAASGQVIRHDGSGFVNAQLAYSDLSGTPTTVSTFTNDSKYHAGEWDTTVKTGSFTVSSQDYFQGFFVDTNTAAVTVTLPASPNDGEIIKVIDVGANASSNNITIARNGNNIQGVAQDLTVAVDRAAFEVIYLSSYGWVLTNK